MVIRVTRKFDVLPQTFGVYWRTSNVLLITLDVLPPAFDVISVAFDSISTEAYIIFSDKASDKITADSMETEADLIAM